MRRLRPDIALGADIIAGFPTETEEMFARSQDLVEECDLTFLHVFPYSKRPGTPAARMPQVAGEAIKERAKRLRAAGEAALRKRLASEIGATRQVLIESGKQGRTEHFLPVAIGGETPGAVRALTDHRARWRAVDGVKGASRRRRRELSGQFALAGEDDERTCQKLSRRRAFSVVIFANWPFALANSTGPIDPVE